VEVEARRGGSAAAVEVEEGRGALALGARVEVGAAPAEGLRAASFLSFWSSTRHLATASSTYFLWSR